MIYKYKARHVQMGYVDGEVRPDGSYIIRTPKGIQHYYSTRQLIVKVTERMDRCEAAGLGRRCYINGMHQLQIRGKHMRRLLKAKPEWKQVGRTICDTSVKN